MADEMQPEAENTAANSATGSDPNTPAGPTLSEADLPAAAQELARRGELPLEGINRREELLTYLAGHFERLLVTDRHGLFQLCYRLDLDEQRVRDILRAHQLKTPAHRAAALAELTLQRELTRLAWRRWYSERG